MTSQPELQRVFGVVAIFDRCGVYECEGGAVAALPVRTSVDTGIWWLCEKHADVLPWLDGIRGRHAAPRVFNINRTCRNHTLVGHPPCGGAADYLPIVGKGDPPELSVISLCRRHAQDLPDDYVIQDPL